MQPRATGAAARPWPRWPQLALASACAAAAAAIAWQQLAAAAAGHVGYPRLAWTHTVALAGAALLLSLNLAWRSWFRKAIGVYRSPAPRMRLFPLPPPLSLRRAPSDSGGGPAPTASASSFLDDDEALSGHDRVERFWHAAGAGHAAVDDPTAAAAGARPQAQPGSSVIPPALRLMAATKFMSGLTAEEFQRVYAQVGRR